MLQRLRHRAGGQEGFTLIELLVVILIIGILAAVAIPAFLNQKGKANDANTKSDITTAQTAEETYFTDGQVYIGGAAGATALENIEPTLKQAFVLSTAATNPGDSMAVVSPAVTIYGGTIVAGATTANSYYVSGTSQSKVNYAVIREADGTVQHVCNVPANTNAAGCTLTAVGATTGFGTW
jgi:type IV pilus assembly protein PilA